MTSSILLKPHNLYIPHKTPQLDPAISYFRYNDTHYQDAYDDVIKRALIIDKVDTNNNNLSSHCDHVQNEINSQKNSTDEMLLDISSSQSSANNFVQLDKASTENEVSFENNLNNSVSSTSSISNSNTNSTSINLSTKSSKSKKKK